MRKSALITLGAVISICMAVSGAIADTIVPDGGFPGKGEYQSWLAANKAYYRGTRQLESLSLDQAIQLFKQAISIYAYDPDYYINLGLAFKKKGDLQSAEKAYRDSISVKETWNAWANLASVLKKEKKFAEARSAYLKALSFNPPANAKVVIEKSLTDLKG